MKHGRLTVLIPAHNSAATIVDILNDVTWADEVLVVDSFSLDDTVKICRERGVRVLQHNYENSAKQKNWAIPECTHPWILVLDTDERLPDALQAEIRSLMQSEAVADCEAYRIARKTMFLGKWMKTMNLWPDYQVRLFRKEVGRYEEKEVHADVHTAGRVGTLKNPLTHNATVSLSKQIGLLDRYSSYKAVDLQRLGRRFRLSDVLIRPAGAFVYLWVMRLGFTEGIRGLFVAFHSMAFSFFSYVKLWELELTKHQKRDSQSHNRRSE